MSDRATLYRLMQENNIQGVLDLYDMIVDEYATDIQQLRARIAALGVAGDRLATVAGFERPTPQLTHAVDAWRKARGQL